MRLTYSTSATDHEGVVVRNPRAIAAAPHAIRLALVGPGSFARSTHIPNLQGLKKRFALRAVVSRKGYNAAALANQIGAEYATTELEKVLEDPQVDALLIATRHDLHASMALRGLEAGKHVFVEKPLALAREELSRFETFYAAIDPGRAVPVLLTGFNRRFSPFARRIQQLVAKRAAPMVIDYRMNAGALPRDHWVQQPEGGGRNRGEACHIYDFFTCLTAATVVDVVARGIAPHPGARRDENFVATLTFADGSLAALTYTSLGNTDYPKERLEVFVDGKVLLLEDYQRLSAVGARERGMETRVADKGHREALEAFADVVQRGGDWPIPLWQQLQATEIALRVEEALGGRA